MDAYPFWIPTFVGMMVGRAGMTDGCLSLLDSDFRRNDGSSLYGNMAARLWVPIPIIFPLSKSCAST